MTSQDRLNLSRCEDGCPSFDVESLLLQRGQAKNRLCMQCADAVINRF